MKSFVMTLMVTIDLFISSWFVMLLLGILHKQYDYIPNFGYWTVFAILAIIWTAAPPNLLYLKKTLEED